MSSRATPARPTGSRRNRADLIRDVSGSNKAGRSGGVRADANVSCSRICKTLPCWYLLGAEDKAIPPALQRFMAERANATIVEVPASHVSFVSQPEAATQLILQAVEATAAAG